MLKKVPFDLAASKYDHEFSDTAVGRCQRNLVWDYLEKKLSPGAAVLELNCGTGVDALWLANRGNRVLATDISAAMVALTRKKVGDQNLEHLIEARVCAIEDLPDLSSDFKPNLVFSNFGGINCVSPDHLRVLNADLRDLLPAHGEIILVVMARFCWQETLYYALKGRFKTAKRRWSGGPLEVPLGAGNSVKTWYYHPKEIADFLPDFAVLAVVPVGFWVPPSYLDPLFKRVPFLLRWCYFFEKQCRFSVLSRWADHYLIHLRKG